MLIVLLFVFLLLTNISCSDTDAINYSVGIFANTLPDTQLTESVQDISNIIKNMYNVSKYSLVVELLTLPDSCDDIITAFNKGYNSSDGEQIKLFFGYWTNISTLECISKTVDIGYDIMNLAMSYEICSNSIYHAYHLQELIYVSTFITSRNFDPVYVVYYIPIHIDFFINSHKFIYQSDPLGVFYYEIENKSQFAKLSDVSDKKGNIVYFLDSYHSGLDEFIESIKPFYNSDNYTLIFIGYINQNLFTSEQIQFLQNAYFVGYYFHSIDNKENRNFIDQMNLLPKRYKYMYDTLSILYHAMSMWYINEFNEVQLKYPSYSWGNQINVIYYGVFGLTYLDISYFYQHPSYIGQLKGDDIVIVFTKKDTSTTSPFLPLNSERQYSVCNVANTPSIYTVPVKYILLVTKKKHFRHFFISALLSLHSDFPFLSNEFYLFALITFYDNVEDIPEMFFKSDVTVTILAFHDYTTRDKLVLRNTERIQLYDLSINGGGLCSRDYISMGLSFNTVAAFMDNSGITKLTNIVFIISSENIASMAVMENIKTLISNDIEYYVIDVCEVNFELIKTAAYISLLPPIDSIKAYEASPFLKGDDSIFIIILFDPEELYEASFKYSNIYTFHYWYGSDDVSMYESSVFGTGRYGMSNYYLESSCAYQYLVNFDSFNEVQANDVLLSCMLGKVSIFSNYLSAPTALTQYRNGELLLSYKLTLATQLYHQLPNHDSFIICHWNTENVVYDVVNYIGFIKPDSSVYTMNMISDARTVIWIFNSEYGGIMGNPISLTIIPYFDKTQSLYQILLNHTNVVFFLSPYFEELLILEKEMKESNRQPKADNLLIAILDYTTGNICNSVFISYGVSIHQILYPTLTSLALKTDSLLLIGLPKSLAEGIVDTYRFYCDAYFMDCKTLVVDKFDLKNKTFFSYLDDYIKKNNTYIINGFFYEDCRDLIPYLHNKLKSTSYVINLVSLFLNRNVLNFFDIYSENVNHILFETVPSGTEQYLLEKYYRPSYTNDTIVPTIVHTWIALYHFKLSAEYVVSLNISILFPKLLTLVNFREGQQKLDNIYSHFSQVVKFDRQNSKYDIEYRILFSLSNVFAYNYHNVYSKVYYTCAIKSYKSEEIISNIAIHVILISTITKSRKKGVIPRISQMVSIIEVNQNSILISGIQYIKPIFMNVIAPISNTDISIFAYKIKEQYGITVSHIFGRYYDDMFLHHCNYDNDNDNDNDIGNIYYSYPILFWNPLFYTGNECVSDSIVYIGLSARQLLQYPLSYMFATKSTYISILYKDIPEIVPYYDMAVSFIILYHATLCISIKLPDNFTKIDIESSFFNILEKMTNGGIILNLLFDDDSSYLYNVLYQHIPRNNDDNNKIIESYYIFSPGSTPLSNKTITAGHFDEMEYYIDRNAVLNDTSIFASTYINLNFIDTGEQILFFDVYLSFKIFEFFLSSSQVNNVSYIMKNIPNTTLDNFFDRTFIVNNDRQIERTTSLARLEEDGMHTEIIFNRTISSMLTPSLSSLSSNSEKSKFLIPIGFYYNTTSKYLTYNDHVTINSLLYLIDYSNYFEDNSFYFIPIFPPEKKDIQNNLDYFRKKNVTHIFFFASTNDYRNVLDLINDYTDIVFHFIYKEYLSPACLPNSLYYSPTNIDFSLDFLCTNVDLYFSLFYVDSDEYVEIVANEIYSLGGYLLDYNMINVDKEITPQVLENYELLIKKAITLHPNNGIFYIIGDYRIMPFLKIMFETFCSIQKRISIFIYGVNIKYIFDNMPKISKPISFYTVGNDITDFRNYFPSYRFEIDNYLDPPVVEVFYALGIIVDIYNNRKEQYNTSSFIKYALNTTIYGLSFNNIHYFSQKLSIYKVTITEDYQNTVENVFSPDLIRKHIPIYDFDYDSSLCIWENTKGRTVPIGLVFSFSGNKQTVDIQMYLNIMVYLMDKNLNPFNIRDEVYYLNPITVDVRSDNSNCEYVFERMRRENVHYIFGLYRSCFSYLSDYKEMVLFYPRISTGTACQKNAVFVGGLYQQLYKKVPSILHHRNITSIILIGSLGYEINDLLTRMSDYLYQFFKSNQTILIPKDHTFLNDIFRPLESHREEKTALILSLDDENMDEFIGYWEERTSLHRYYLPLFFRLSEDYIMKRKPNFDLSVFTFYTYTFQSEDNEYYKNSLNNVYGRKYSSLNGESGYNTINIFVQIVKKVESFDIDIVMNNIYRENYSSPEGNLIFNSDGYITKNVYYIEYDHLSEELNLIYNGDRIYPETRVIPDNSKEYVKGSFCIGLTGEIVKVPYYEVMIYLGSNDTELYLLKQFVALYGLFDEIVYHYTLNFVYMNYTIDVSGILFSYSQNAYAILKNALKRDSFLGLFIAYYDELIESLNDDIKENEKLILYISPNEPGYCDKYVISFDGIDKILLEHTVELITIQKSGMISDFLIIYQNTTREIRRLGYLVDAIVEFFHFIPKYIISADELRNGTVYDFKSIREGMILIPNGIENLFKDLINFVDVDQFSVVVFFYRDNMINPFNFNLVAYVTTFSEEDIIKKAEAISKLKEGFNVYELSFDYYYGGYENVASLSFAYSLFSLAVYNSFVENKVTSQNIHQHLLSFKENVNDYYFIGANNYAYINYYLVVMSQESNLTIQFSNYLAQNPYDTDYVYCDWRDEMVEKTTYDYIINIAIIYTNTQENVIFDPQALPVFLYEVDYSNANFELGNHYFKTIAKPINNNQNCGIIIKDLIENYNVKYVFGGLYAECRQSVNELLKDSEIDFLFFFNGEVDRMMCDKHIISLGPSPMQITDILIKETGLNHKGFIIIYSTKSLYSSSLYNVTVDALYTFGFDVYKLNESEWIDVSEFLLIDTIDNLVDDYVVVNELNDVEEVIKFFKAIKKNERLFGELDYVHLSIDDNFLFQLKAIYKIDFKSYLPYHSYFISNFFADLFSLTNDFTRFDVKFDKHMLLLLQNHLGVAYFLTSLSSQTYLAFEMFKSMLRYTHTLNVDEIRLALYQRGFLGPAGTVVLQYNNYLAMRMYFGEYDWAKDKIIVQQSPNDFILPHNFFNPLNRCDCSKNVNYSDDDDLNYYHLIMVFEHWNVAPYVTVALTFFNIITNYNIGDNNGAGLNGKIIIPHMYFARHNQPSSSFLEMVYSRNVIAVFGCYTVRCGLRVGDITDEYHIPFFYFGPYCVTYSPYTFFISPHLDTVVRSTVSYLEKLKVVDMVIIDGDYSNLNSTNYDEEIIVNGTKTTKPTNKLLLKLIENYSYEYNCTINVVDYYSVSNKSQLHPIMQKYSESSVPTVLFVLLNGPLINSLLEEYEEIKNQNPYLLFLFLYYNYYIIEDRYKYLLQGHLAITSYVRTSSNIDSMTFYLKIENGYGTPIEMTDGIVDVEISFDFVTTTFQLLISTLFHNIELPSKSTNDKNNKYLGDYMKMESYYVNVTSPLGVVSITFGNQFRASVSISELSDTGNLKLLNVYETSEDVQEDYYYGPDRKFLAIDETTRVIIGCLFIIQIVLLLISGGGVYYFSRIKPSKIIKNYGTNYFYLLLFCDALMTLLSVFSLANHTQINCYLRGDSLFIVYSFTYGIIFFKYCDIKRVAQNKYISRVRITWYGYILNTLMFEVIIVILIIIWNVSKKFGLKYIYSEMDSTLFEIVYIVKCDYYGVGFGLMAGVIIVLLLVDIKISWDLRFLSDYYLFTSVLVSIILISVISVLLTLIISLSEKMYSLDYMLWSYMLFVMAFLFWISIFVRIYIFLYSFNYYYFKIELFYWIYYHIETQSDSKKILEYLFFFFLKSYFFLI